MTLEKVLEHVTALGLIAEIFSDNSGIIGGFNKSKEVDLFIYNERVFTVRKQKEVWQVLANNATIVEYANNLEEVVEILEKIYNKELEG